jgi:hypothetical protein
MGALAAALLALVVLAVDLPVVHDHDGDGLYDEDCPFVRLATAAPRVPLPQTTAVPQPLLTLEAPPVLPSAETALARVAPGVPRAPPPLV